MIVEQIWTGNAYRNFNYLIACPDTGEALAVDPLDYEKCLARAADKGFTVTQILNTHEHGDHTGGNAAMIEATGAKLLAHKNAGPKIEGMDVGLEAGDVVKVGKSVELLALDTPGHTMSHVCLLSKTDTPALFCGDTLFNAGAGNCHGGGHPDELYDTFAQQLADLPQSTLVYPGHDYITNNLGFTLDREPDNQKAAELLAKLESSHDPDAPLVTSLALEKEINTFFRLTNPSVIARIKEAFPDLPDEPTPRQVFLKLRELPQQLVTGGARSVSQAIDTNFIYRALIIVGLIAFGFYIAAERGLVTLALTSDRSYISYVIFTSYLLATAHWLWLAMVLTRERRRFFELEQDQTRLPEPGDGLLGEFFGRLMVKPGVNVDGLLGAFGDNLANRHAFGHFASEALLKLGLLGTIVGFILMLLPVGEISEFDPAQMQRLLGSMGGGMAVALYTTLAGLVTSTLLKLQYHMIDGSAADLATRLQIFVDVHYDRHGTDVATVAAAGAAREDPAAHAS